MIISIDPGLTGAIALLSDPDTVVKVWDMPVMTAIQGKGNVVNPHLLADIIKETVELGGSSAYVEAQHAMVKQSSTDGFKQGTGYGVIQGVLAYADLPIKIVTAKKWKGYHCLSRSHVKQRLGREPSYSEFKDAARLMALECFPDQAENLKLKKHDGRADSMMIGRFAFSRI